MACLRLDDLARRQVLAAAGGAAAWFLFSLWVWSGIMRPSYMYPVGAGFWTVAAFIGLAVGLGAGRNRIRIACLVNAGAWLLLSWRFLAASADPATVTVSGLGLVAASGTGLAGGWLATKLSRS